MKYIIKKLPKNVIYDYTDIFGGRHYHGKTRKYTVYRGIIFSEKNNEE